MIIIGWLVLSIATAVIASNKGRSGFGWLLIGLCLPLIGFIMALVISPSPAAPIESEPAAHEGLMKKCPDCIEIVPAEARVCSHCGYRFDGSEPLVDSRPFAPNIDISRWSARDRENFWREYQPRPRRAGSKSR